MKFLPTALLLAGAVACADPVVHQLIRPLSGLGLVVRSVDPVKYRGVFYDL